MTKYNTKTPLNYKGVQEELTEQDAKLVDDYTQCQLKTMLRLYSIMDNFEHGECKWLHAEWQQDAFNNIYYLVLLNDNNEIIYRKQVTKEQGNSFYKDLKYTEKLNKNNKPYYNITLVKLP